MRPIALLTDFGVADHYVGVLHAVLVREAPGVERIDLGHEVPPGDVWAGCYLLRCAWPHLPRDCVVVAVVDPGVGGSRRPMAVRVSDRWLVAPDNGMAAAVTPVDGAVQLDWRLLNVPPPSRTFHGRDLFAPAAARLAVGVKGEEIGEPVEPSSLVACPLPDAERISGGWRATIVHVDRFGNLVTNLVGDQASMNARADAGGGLEVRRVATYGEGGDGEVVLLTGSSGLLELAVNCASAEERTGLRRGDTVEVLGSSVEGETRNEK